MFKLVVYSPESVLDAILNRAGHQHFVCKAARDVKELAHAMVNFQPHVILVVGNNQFIESTLPLIRQMALDEADTGLIFLANEYNVKMDRECFLSGADHFLLVHTPYEALEPKIKNLCAKIEKLRVRGDLHVLPSSKPHDEPLRISLDGKTVEHNGEVLNLSPIQHSLAMVFLSHADRLLSRKDLVNLVWKNEKISSRSIDAQISKLKKEVPYFQKTLTSLYGRGYVYRTNERKVA